MIKPMSAILFVALLLTAGSAAADPTPGDPAAALCVKNGATIATEPLANGAKRSVCVFPNGSRIDAGAYFRNKHRSH